MEAATVSSCKKQIGQAEERDTIIKLLEASRVCQPAGYRLQVLHVNNRILMTLK